MRAIHSMKVLSGIAALLLAFGGNALAGAEERGYNPPPSYPPPSQVPEIDANTGGTALALLIGGLLLVSERAGSSRKS